MAAEIMSPTAYDDVFRTLLNDCSKLIIPVINEVFGENYTGSETIIFLPNEHFLNQQDGSEQKRITDTSFAIIGTEKKRYHMECESTPDYRILIRIFEYDAQIALDQNSEIIENRIIVSFPNTAVLFLRSTGTTPDKMEIVIRTPGGEVSYDVPVMKVRSYTIEEIFAKKLLFLIPFHIFTYEADFRKINEDIDRLDALKTEYASIAERLEKMAANGEINQYDKKTIMDMSERVVANLAKNYENIVKGVGTVMSGQVLDYEAKAIKTEAYGEGVTQGRQEGRKDQLIDLVKKGLLTVAIAAKEAGMTEADFSKQMGAV